MSAENYGLLEAVGKDVGDFTGALFDSAIEQPINAVMQIAEKVSGASLPKLDLVEPAKSTAGTVGSIAGQVLDVYLLSKVVGGGLGAAGVPATGTAAQALRLGATGFVYGSVFKSSAESADNFLVSRLKNGAVEGGTWATMSLAASGLAKANTWEQVQFSGIFGHVFRGAAGGAIGGAANAELDSLLNKGRFATSEEVGSKAGQFAVAGGIFGAIGWAQTKLDMAMHQAKTGIPNKFEAHPKEIVRVSRNANGDVDGIKIVDESILSPTARTQAYDVIARRENGAWVDRYSEPAQMRTLNQLPNGTVVGVGQPVKTMDNYGTLVSIYGPGKNYRAIVETEVPDILSSTRPQFSRPSAESADTVIEKIYDRYDSFDRLKAEVPHTLKEVLDAATEALRTSKTQLQ